jgi:hypothetical protein
MVDRARQKLTLIPNPATKNSIQGTKIQKEEKNNAAAR